jgi:hypothetical protein
MPEDWRDVQGYEGKYQVSNLGRVRSLARCWPLKAHKVCLADAVMSLQRHYSGYLFVHLYKGNKRQKFFVHQLVARAFLPNPEGKPVVNHKDRNRAHNCAYGCGMCHDGNLEWNTVSENNRHYMAIDKAEAECDIPF